MELGLPRILSVHVGELCLVVLLHKLLLHLLTLNLSDVLIYERLGHLLRPVHSYAFRLQLLLESHDLRSLEGEATKLLA